MSEQTYQIIDYGFAREKLKELPFLVNDIKSPFSYNIIETGGFSYLKSWTIFEMASLLFDHGLNVMIYSNDLGNVLAVDTKRFKQR